jgi:hypothetical protein
MNLDTVISELGLLVKRGQSGVPVVGLLASAMAKLEEARAAFDHLVRDMDEEELAGCIGNRATDFLCGEVEVGKAVNRALDVLEEAEYCDGCTCRFTWRMDLCVVDRMPRTVGAATRGESATLCRACHAVATAKGGAR